MGWLWASPSPTAPTQPQSLPKPDPAQNAAPNEPVDPEIQKFFDLFKTDADNTSSNEPPPTPASRQDSDSDSTSSSSPSTIASWLSLKAAPKSATPPAPAPPRDALAESLLPTEMSCRQAFDLAWACNSMGGQFNSVYRYGSMRSCSEHWDDFWFCMRTKSYTGELKESMIRQHYRNKEYAKYGPQKPSSEDIWESRTQKVSPGTAFSERIDEPEVGDDEWRRREARRRREIRQGLGYGEVAS
ncbi:hypothetical protein HRG_002366 [Hirsutella rhossiliensis]|uniref:Early meiotic induction protein 1 n=1 Tax=Hirsutella rhossiliensis TaxID=111463 RepID=A0A9P8N987_9HYPO|nr:uncharacterized protein HRG_02366 [Hirsutella rhossiliensis]KAH0966957.1 hypothetical protein HRG_02366 [Hirsutella rhossiliensis]